MQSIAYRKAYQGLILLLIAIAIGSVIACQVHAVPHDHAQPASRHHHQDPTPHAGFDLLCLGLVAILPGMSVFLSWYVAAVRIPFRACKVTAPIYPPFVPPRFLTY